MAGVITDISTAVLEGYNSFIASLPTWAQSSINLFLLVLIIVFYSYFVWKLYRFIATKNLLGLNLNKYNKSEHPLFTKLIAGTLYLIEYIIILPFLVFFWFVVFTMFLIVLSKTTTISQILIISATVIAAVRMTSYINEDLSKEVAKFLPFTLLAVSILNPNFFSEAQYLERIINLFSQIPELFGQIIYYLIFIIALEIILRFFDFIFSLFGLEEVHEIKEKIKEEQKQEEKI